MPSQNAEKIRPLNLDQEAKAPIASSIGHHFKINWKLVGAGMLVVFLGALSGFGLSLLTAGKSGTAEEEVSTESIGGRKVKAGEVYGSESDLFKDEATGVIEANGIEGGEGTHKLVREGGESQTAYLTSSVVDLDLFVGYKVEVWGETFAAQKAGWFLDVGRIKVLE